MSTEPPAQPRFPGAGTRPQWECLTSSSRPQFTQQEPPEDLRCQGQRAQAHLPDAPPPPDPSKGPCRPAVPCTLPWSMLNPQGLLKHPVRPMEAPWLPLRPCPAVLPLRPGSPAEQVGKL